MTYTRLLFPACDLREHAPRSPRAKIGGLFFLARTIDKVRAQLQDTLGPYTVSPGMSVTLLDWLGITEGSFAEAVRVARGDDDVVCWLLARTDSQKFHAINVRLETRAIRDDRQFRDVLPRYPVLAVYPHVRNWFEIFDLHDAWVFRAENRGSVAASS